MAATAPPRKRPTWLLRAGVIILVLSGTPSWGASPLVTEVRAFTTRYHENLPRLDTIRYELQQEVKAHADVESLVAFAQVCFVWGDVRATTSTQKLESYEWGRTVAKRAMELKPQSAEAHFWYATNTARWAQANGVIRSLFLLSTIQEEIQLILELDPTFTPVYSLAGNVLYEVPRLLGGDPSKAEEMFRKGLEQDSKFTGMRVGLAKTLIKLGRKVEARRELQAVLDEKEPRNLADWVMKDSKQARIILDTIH